MMCSQDAPTSSKDPASSGRRRSASVYGTRQLGRQARSDAEEPTRCDADDGHRRVLDQDGAADTTPPSPPNRCCHAL